MTKGREQMVIGGCGVGGFATVAAVLATNLSNDDVGSNLRLLWATPLIVLPLISLGGGWLVPTRRRAVVLATVATWFLLILASKVMSLTVEILAWQVLLAVLCFGGATVGRRWAQRTTGGRPTSVPVT